MKFIAYNALAIALVGLAAYMVYADKPHYGWVIFAALLVAVGPNVKDDGDKEDKEDE